MREASTLIGWGMASGAWDANRLPAAARAVLTADGKLTVSSATADIGTGTYTIMTQIAAERLGLPVEDVTGAERLATGTPVSRQLVQVIGYPNATNQPVTCQNWLRHPMAGQLEFDCGGYTNGTSGGPFLSEVDQATGQGLVIGVIGGYQQGGDTPQVSYSAVLGANAAALYEQAVAGG